MDKRSDRHRGTIKKRKKVSMKNRRRRSYTVIVFLTIIGIIMLMPKADSKDIENVGSIIKDEEKGLITEQYREKEANENQEKVDVATKRVIDPNKPMIALTFDDGPSQAVTISILDTLKEHDSAATFFILGNNVSDNADALELLLEEENEIGNHSYSHKNLTKISYEELSEQIINTQSAVLELTGVEPRLLRPTYGSYNDDLRSSLEMPFVLWSVDTQDWKSRNPQKIANHVLGNAKDGDIVLMHDIYDTTAEAVKILVPELKNRGYQLVTVSEMFEARGEILEDGEIYTQSSKK